ncbi:MAG: DUF3332 domain-containing protein [Prevotella sp.]|nr:DUF3332 domain-containing protein [Prevotella sp.]
MKKMNLKAVALLLLGSVAFSSCVGSFSLFNKYADWQTHMTGNKFVNGIVGIILLPIVGSVCMFVDAIVLNTIEFWSGENPLASNVGKTQQVMGSDGKLYAVTMLKNGYEVKAPTGELSYFIYDKQNDTWSLQQNGVTRQLFRYNADGTLTVTMPDAQQLTVNADQAGLNLVRSTVDATSFYASR